MTDLISRLESATAGSRELSDEVLMALGWRRVSEETEHGDYVFWCPPDRYAQFTDERPCPTTSLDAALELVPEGWEWMLVGSGAARLWRGSPSLSEICRDLADNMMPRRPRDCVVGVSESGDATLALCSAILKSQEGTRAREEGE